MNEQSIPLLLKSALPILDIDQMVSPGANFAIVWVDISERPDLGVLSQHEPATGAGYSICTLFYASEGLRSMKVGIRIEMRQPVHFVITLAIPVNSYLTQLQTISQEGNLWIVPGPIPRSLVGNIPMTSQEFLQRVVSHAGQGLFITLEDHLVSELRGQLERYKKAKRG